MRRLFRLLFDQKRILGGTVVVAIGQMGASIAGLVRDRLFTHTFPGLDTVDIYIASFRPSDLLFQIFIMAAFSVALVPLLASYYRQGNAKQMEELTNGAVFVSVVVFSVISVVFATILPWVAPLLTQFRGESLDLYVQFGRMALVTNLIFVLANAYGQYLLTIQRYWIYGVTPILYTVGTILGTLFLTPIYGAYGPMLGTLGGAVVCALGRLVALLHIGYRPRLVWWHADLGEMGLLMLPRMMALGIIYVELLFFDGIASGLPAGAVTVNQYTRNFQSVVIGITGIALSLAIFSMLSQSASGKDWKRYWVYLRKGTWFLLALTIPGAIGLVLCTPIAIWLVGLSKVATLFASCLLLYAFSIPFESLNLLFTKAFFAAKNSTVPAIFNVVNGLIAVGIAWYFAPRIGVISLPLGYTIGHVVQMFGLMYLLPERRVLRTEDLGRRGVL